MFKEEGRIEGIQEGKEEGIQIGSVLEAQGILLDILSDRYGKLPSSLKKKIRSLEDTSLLRSLCIQVFKVDSLEDFIRLIKVLKN